MPNRPRGTNSFNEPHYSTRISGAALTREQRERLGAQRNDRIERRVNVRTGWEEWYVNGERREPSPRDEGSLIPPPRRARSVREILAEREIAINAREFLRYESPPPPTARDWGDVLISASPALTATEMPPADAMYNRIQNAVSMVRSTSYHPTIRRIVLNRETHELLAELLSPEGTRSRWEPRVGAAGFDPSTYELIEENGASDYTDIVVYRVSKLLGYDVIVDDEQADPFQLAIHID